MNPSPSDDYAKVLPPIGTDEALVDWLGRFDPDPEALELNFQGRGLTTLQEVCAANLSADDLVTLGVEPKWRRSSMLRGISEAIDSFGEDGTAGFENPMIDEENPETE